MQLLELARNCPEIANALENDEQWVGTASQLESILTRSDAQTRHAAVRLLSWTNSCGILLSKLADNPEAGVQKVGLTVSSRIQQYRIGALNGCEAEEVRSSLATSL